jgi:hypothetical protein
MSTILEERRKIVAKIIKDFITEIKPFLISGKMFSTKNLNNIFFEEKIEELIEDKDFLEYKNGYIIRYFSNYRRKFKNENEKNFFGVPVSIVSNVEIKVSNKCQLKELENFKEIFIKITSKTFDEIIKKGLGNVDINTLSLKQCVDILKENKIFLYVPPYFSEYRRRKINDDYELNCYFSSVIKRNYLSYIKEKAEKVFKITLIFFENDVLKKFYFNQLNLFSFKINKLGLLENGKTLENEIDNFLKELETKYFEKEEIKPLLETI